MSPRDDGPVKPSSVQHVRSLDQGVLELLAQCDREDEHNPPQRRFLYTSEIRRLLGVGSPPTYEGLQRALDQQDAELRAARDRAYGEGRDDEADALPLRYPEER